MATEGPNYGTGSNIAGVGTVAWTNATNAGADDGSDATVTLASTEESNYLSVQALGFAVSGMVDGITVEIEWSMSGKLSTPAIIDTTVILTADGSTPVGDNKAIGSDLPISPTVQSFGGAADLWGTTWSAATINGATFGPMLSLRNDGAASRDGQVDFMRVTVDYTDQAWFPFAVLNQPWVRQTFQVVAYKVRQWLPARWWEVTFGKCFRRMTQVREVRFG